MFKLYYLTIELFKFFTFFEKIVNVLRQEVRTFISFCCIFTIIAKLKETVAPVFITFTSWTAHLTT